MQTHLLSIVFCFEIISAFMNDNIVVGMVLNHSTLQHTILGALNYFPFPFYIPITYSTCLLSIIQW